MNCTLYNTEPMVIVSHMDAYFKQKPPDCSFFSQDNFEFPVHKEVLYQTKYLREMTKSVDNNSCCCKIEMLFPSLKKDELGIIVEFLYSGKISCPQKPMVTQTCTNLSQLFGFPSIQTKSPEQKITQEKKSKLKF